MTVASQTCTQLSLDLFPLSTFESIFESNRVNGMSVRFSGRLRRGWYVKMNTRLGTACLVVPAFLETAPHDIKTALVQWAVLTSACGRRRRDRNTSRQRKSCEGSIYGYIDSIGMVSPRVSRADPASFVFKGLRWDLSEVFDTLNTTYFDGSLSSYVRWGISRFRSYQSTRTGANGRRFSIITIATMYNRPDTPRFAIEGIMFHEMLHIAVPPVKRNFRNIIHGPEFKQRERQFPFRAQWLAWEKSLSNRTV